MPTLVTALRAEVARRLAADNGDPLTPPDYDPTKADAA